MVEGLSKYFGDHPCWFYVLVFAPAMFTVIYPFVIYGLYFYARETLDNGKSPEMVYATLFYVLVFSIIGHKEKRFLLPVFAFCVLSVGYLLFRKVKVWKSKVKYLIYLSVGVELSIQASYHLHHKLWVFTDHMLEAG